MTIGIGDDTAGYRFEAGRETLVTTDMLLDGSCFILAEAGAEAVGRKALAVNLSDIAAMAGVPRAAVISLALPRAGGAEIARGVFGGIRKLAAEYEVDIIGGDTNSWDGPLAISITLMGEATTKPPVRRSGAKVGDAIFVTGRLGGSILGKHLTFMPRVREALRLHERFDLHSMIDISDGLARDLHHICTASGCGAVLEASEIPLADAAHELSRRDGASPLEHALRDGEDFELCFTVAEADAACVEAEGCHRIGRIVESDYTLILEGEPVPLSPRGYEHKLDRGE